jgi:beta-mannosidase
MSDLNLLNAVGMDEFPALNWEVGFHEEKDNMPDRWFPAIVPGAVQLDYANAHNWGPYWYADNWKDYGWMEDVYWTCRAVFEKPELPEGRQAVFYSKGIDYEFDVFLNGNHLLYQEGMFTPVRIDLTEHLKQRNELRVRIYPAPKAHRNSRDRSQADRSVKPAVSYGWDWHPRLIPLGIWDETGIRLVNSRRLDEFEINYVLDEEFPAGFAPCVLIF